jgi:hypothetical protein
LGWGRVWIGHASLSVAVLMGCAAATCQTAANPHLPGPMPGLLRAAADGQADAGAAKYVGPGSCGASACHGNIRPLSKTKVWQNEYSTWVTSDKHAHAYRALQEPLGKQIGQILKLPEPPESSQRCLVCHAVSVPPAAHARDFDIAEGVSCESCHGPASLWLEPHIEPTAKHLDLVEKLHLYDNKNLEKRAERCLYCHLGAPGAIVDHELIAAGHPDLTFELDSFSASEPPHWADKNADGSPADALFGVRVWSVGQAVALKQSMLRVANHAKAGPWPEFSEMDCVTCHHSLTGPQSWRRQSAAKMRVASDPSYAGRIYGQPPYNLSRYVLFKHFAAELNPGLNEELSKASDMVKEKVTSMSPNRAEVETAANHAAELAGQLIADARDASYDGERTKRLLRAITGDADAIAFDGERTAEQATMTVNSLYIAAAKADGPDPATRQAIDGLFKLVNNQSSYDARQFAEQLRAVRSTLR